MNINGDMINRFFVAATIALVPLSALAFYLGIEFQKHVQSDVWFAGKAMYTSEVIGVTFSYPKSLGPIDEEVLEKGECSDRMKTKEDGCDHRYAGFVGEHNRKKWFLSAESALFIQNPTPREGRSEDTLRVENVENYCTGGPNPPVSCKKGINDFGLRYIKAGFTPACNGFEVCSDQLFHLYFIETGNEHYPVVVLLSESSAGRYDVPGEAIEGMVRTMRPKN